MPAVYPAGYTRAEREGEGKGKKCKISLVPVSLANRRRKCCKLNIKLQYKSNKRGPGYCVKVKYRLVLSKFRARDIHLARRQ